MGKRLVFRDVELFLQQTWQLVDRSLLVEVYWSHAGGYTDYAVFEDFQSFTSYVRACPKRTIIQAFPKTSGIQFSQEVVYCSSLAVGVSSDYLAGWIVMVLIIPGSLLSHFRLLLLASRRRLTLSASFRL